ncbi:MAG: hypothetical protein Q7R93_04265 [bacterium]|nr:hypothetical protein [bacterium]
MTKLEPISNKDRPKNEILAARGASLLSRLRFAPAHASQGLGVPAPAPSLLILDLVCARNLF